MTAMLATREPQPSAPGRPAHGPASGPNSLGAASAARLLDEAAAGPADRVLILGPPSADLLCEALRHGCRAAQEAAVPPRRPEAADLVVAPHVVSEAAADAVAVCARRALAGSPGGGRLALRLLGVGARALARSMTRRLRDYGFERIRLRAMAEGDLLLVCRMLPASLGHAPR